jgi:hypothetical protein
VLSAAKSRIHDTYATSLWLSLPPTSWSMKDEGRPFACRDHDMQMACDGAGFRPGRPWHATARITRAPLFGKRRPKTRNPPLRFRPRAVLKGQSHHGS